MAHPLVQRAFELAQSRDGAEEAGALCIARLIDAPDDSEALFILGVTYRHRNMTEQALACYRRAYVLSDWYTAAVFNMGRCLHTLGHYEQAVEAFRKARADWPDDPLVAFCLGDSYTALQDYEAAAEGYDACTKLSQDTKAYANKAMCLRQLGRIDEAEEAYRQAVRLEPDFDSAWFGLGIVARMQGQPTAAIAAFSRSIRITPDGCRGWFQSSGMHLMLGDYGSALRQSEAAIARDPQEFYAYCYRAEALEGLGHAEAAYAAYGRARKVNLGYGMPETRRLMYRLRQSYGPPRMDPAKAPVGTGEKGLVTMRSLGANGRFGNQILQYGFLRLYAARHGVRYQVSEWMGQYLFDLVDPTAEALFPVYEEAWGGLESSLIEARPKVQVNRDVEGYFCRSTHFMAGGKALFRSLFTPGERFRSRLDEAVAALRSRGRTIVAVHIRRGDFGWGPFWVAPVKWYRTWLARLWPFLADPVLYVASDAPGMAAAFAEYNPVTLDDIGGPIPDLAFFVDHVVLSRADVVGISNSTFSFTATMLNETGTLFFRPDKHRQEMVPYDPWNADVLI